MFCCLNYWTPRPPMVHNNCALSLLLKLNVAKLWKLAQSFSCLWNLWRKDWKEARHLFFIVESYFCQKKSLNFWSKVIVFIQPCVSPSRRKDINQVRQISRIFHEFFWGGLILEKLLLKLCYFSRHEFAANRAKKWPRDFVNWILIFLLKLN